MKRGDGFGGKDEHDTTISIKLTEVVREAKMWLIFYKKQQGQEGLHKNKKIHWSPKTSRMKQKRIACDEWKSAKGKGGKSDSKENMSKNSKKLHARPLGSAFCKRQVSKN